MARTFQMTSPLPRDELVATLREQIDSPWRFFGRKAVIGETSRSSLSLWMRTGYRNSFQTILTASLSDDDGGTLLRCRTGMSRFVIAFLCVWFGGVITIGGAVVPAMLSDGLFKPESLIVPGMLLFGVGLATLGRWMAQGQDEFLVSFLEDAVDARR